MFHLARLAGVEVRHHSLTFFAIEMFLLSKNCGCLGKTICLGTRLAKLELKLVTAMFVLGFRHSSVDKMGKPSNPLPVPNWNDILLCRPPVGSFKLKYERTSRPL